ncbi:MAG TPA: c-type cytochrome [Gemmataceae bacterium]|nr:c-type cytochrome [Gemmataceae bacterium]
MIKLRKRRWRLLALLAALAAGCDLPGRPNPADRPVPADQVKDFAALYATHCAGCHGAEGKLGPAPPLNDAMFLAIVPDSELLRVITEGRAVTPAQKSPMPAFVQEKGGPLTAAQVKALAEGIKERWGGTRPESQSLPPYLASAEVSGARKHEGEQVFARACAGCHGQVGKSAKPEKNAKPKKDGERSIGAITDPAFLALISDQELRRFAITGRSDLGMPAFDGKKGRPPEFRPLSSAEIDDLVAFLAHRRRGGPGKDQ